MIYTAYKILGTLTFPAAETKSIGWLANAHGVMVFAAPPRLLYRDQTTFVDLFGLAKTTPPRR